MSKSKLEQLKSIGEAADWLTEEGYTTLSKGYLAPGETPRAMYRRIASTSAKYLKEPSNYEEDLFQAMWKGWVCPASPILRNFGNDSGLPISCNLNTPGDSLDSILDKNHELGILSKYGAGVGINLNLLRPSGSAVKGTGGTSDGVIAWSKIYDATIHSVSQGASRRGSASVNLSIESPDIDDFLDMRLPTGDQNRRCHNLNHCVSVSDEYMESLEAGDVENRRKWEKILTERVKTGEPYILFEGNVNKANPQMYKDRGFFINYTNICCLGGDTLVETRYHGSVAIKDLPGKIVHVYDGNDWVRCQNFAVQGTAELTRIHFEKVETIEGITRVIKEFSIDATSTHKWPVLTYKGDKRKYEMVTTKKLETGSLVESIDALYDIRVVKKEKLKGLHEVYCPTVPSTGKFALSMGVITGNSEIMLFSDPDHTLVCCLLSMNLTKWDEWKNTNAVELATKLLDSVLSEYIEKGSKIRGLEAAVRFAEKSRAIGIGGLGWHSLLQSKMLAFDSFESMMLNSQIWKHIRDESLRTSQEMAITYGEPEWCKGYGVRFTHKTAIAPTVTNSLVAGAVSAGIEPWAANVFVQNSAKGTFIRRNKELEKLLDSKGANTEEVWNQIIKDNGSVLNVKQLTKEEKEVFLTARELNQFAIIKQAAQRQQFVDQGQSVNLFFAQNSDPKYIHDVHMEAWKSGLKSLYYCRSESVLRADLASRNKDECAACEA